MRYPIFLAPAVNHGCKKTAETLSARIGYGGCSSSNKYGSASVQCSKSLGVQHDWKGSHVRYLCFLHQDQFSCTGVRDSGRSNKRSKMLTGQLAGQVYPPFFPSFFFRDGIRKQNGPTDDCGSTTSHYHPTTKSWPVYEYYTLSCFYSNRVLIFLGSDPATGLYCEGLREGF